jgi:hypothetical protein
MVIFFLLADSLFLEGHLRIELYLGPSPSGSDAPRP